MKLTDYSDNRLELERADCDLGYFARTLKSLGRHREEFYILVMLQTLEALSFVHSAGLVHCDVKPSNILMKFDLDGNFIIKLCDFGLSHLQSDKRVILKGTSGYTDPVAVIDK